jgi:hypothetical protein
MNASRAQRIGNALLGSWLIASAFIWPHAPSQRANLCLVGTLAIAFALTAIRHPRVRYLNSLLALWLLMSAWAGEVATDVTTWHNTIIAFAMFALSLFPMDPTPPSASSAK